MTPLVALAVLLALASACSSDGSDGAAGGGHRPGEERAVGTKAGGAEVEDAPDGLTPIDPPDGFVEVAGAGFTLHAPPSFGVEKRTSSNGEPLLVLKAAEQAGATAPTVGVVRDLHPRAGALEQSLTLERAKRLVSEATGVRRTVVSWPGSSQAVLVEWTEQKGAGATPAAPVRTVQLLAEVDDDLILSVVAVAPAASFDESQVATVLRTFRPVGSAS